MASAPRRSLATGLATCVVALLVAAPVAAADAPLTGDDLLAHLTDPVAATAPLPLGARVIQRSSHEREGGNRDWGVWSTDEGRPPTFVRHEDGGYVLLDEQRPGCLTRMWFTAGPVAVTHIANIGHVQLFFDGEATPRVDAPADDFFAGRVPGFPQPLVGDADSSSGGHFSYVPFCFARSLKLRVTQVPDDKNLWYQLDALVLPHGTPVETYRPESLATGRAAAALQNAGAAPSGEPVTAERALQPGDRLPLVDRRGAGSVRWLRFAVTPFLPDTLAGLELRVTMDGASDPQVDVPLGDLFGDGLELRPIKGLAFGMDPVGGTGYFALPIPYRNGVSAELISHTPATVRAEARLGPPLPDAGTFYGRRTVETSRKGTDFTALDAGGSGRLAAWVLDLIGPPGSDLGGIQFFLEGDERVYVDGSPSPTIYGTGTEDAFNGGFYYSRGLFSLPIHGAGLFGSRDEQRGARSQYRVFGGDGYRWEDGIHFGMEHGGGDEADGEITASTAFWYGGPTQLRETDDFTPGDARARAAHRWAGPADAQYLAAYFEGDRDGDGVVSPDFQFGGTSYPAPPPDQSPEGVSADGAAFGAPVSFNLAVDPGNCGVVLRRQLDDAQPSTVDVAVDGRAVGPWAIAEANTAKRWLADDFEIAPRFTVGKRTIRITLTPTAGTTATAYRLQALSRKVAQCPAAARSTSKRHRKRHHHRRHRHRR